MSGKSNNSLRELLARLSTADDRPRIPEDDALLAALKREHGQNGGKPMMIRGLVCIALLGLAGCAQTQHGHFAIRAPAITPRPDVLPLLRVLPPEEFDHPYKGWLTIERSASQSVIKGRCSPTTFSYHLGCARKSAMDVCYILMADDETIRQSGWTPEIVLRHEIGHCNGWPADHRGARQP